MCNRTLTSLLSIALAFASFTSAAVATEKASVIAERVFRIPKTTLVRGVLKYRTSQQVETLICCTLVPCIARVCHLSVKYQRHNLIYIEVFVNRGLHNTAFVVATRSNQPRLEQMYVNHGALEHFLSFTNLALLMQ